MSNWKRVGRVYAALLVLSVLCLVVNARAAEEPQKEKGETKGKTMTLDLSKASPETVEKILALLREEKKEKEEKKEQGGKKGFFDKKGFEGKFGKKEGFGKKKEAEDTKAPEDQTLTLVKAIALVEKMSGGQATKAEMHGEGGKAHFTIEISDKLGHRRVELSATGTVLKEGERGGWGRGGFYMKGDFGKKGDFFKKGEK